MVAVLTFLAVSAQVPHYSIGTVTTTDVNGKVDSLNVHCSVSGVVYGINLRHVGLQFFMNDHTGGVEVFSSTKTFGYTVHEGDSIFVSGKVKQFNGAIEFQTLDTVYFLAASAIVSPRVVTQLDKSTDAFLVRVNNLHLTSAWTPAGTGFTVNASDGTNTFPIRVDTLSTAYTMPAPQGNFDLIGIGDIFTQDTANFTTGWQIHPRYSSDFILQVGINEVENKLSGTVFPNPANDNLVIALGDNKITAADVKMFDLSGRVVYSVNTAVNDFIHVNTSTLTTGLYVVEVRSGNQVFRDKIAVQK